MLTSNPDVKIIDLVVKKPTIQYNKTTLQLIYNYNGQQIYIFYLL